MTEDPRLANDGGPEAESCEPDTDASHTERVDPSVPPVTDWAANCVVGVLPGVDADVRACELCSRCSCFDQQGRLLFIDRLTLGKLV